MSVATAENRRSPPRPACAICGASPCLNPSFCRVCRGADAKYAAERQHESADALRVCRLLDDSVSLERCWAALNQRHHSDAPQMTVEALVYDLRTHGLAAFEHPSCRRRLTQVSAEQLREVMTALIRVRVRCAAVTDELLIALDRIKRP